jgi:signal peptidase I
MVDFDIISGDALFVDRMSYHFVSPKVGDSIVFKTSKIKSLVAEPEKYYIKRLVGVGGDVLKIKEPILYRNGKPINGVAPFDKNNKALGDYKGYKAEEALAEGKEVEILPNHYYAMGDNSGNSADSRYWGQVPDTEVLGRALFIYYPFSSHWGLTE